MRSVHVRSWVATLLAASAWLGCADDGTGGTGGAGGAAGGGGAAPNLDFEAGADRPVLVRVPAGYSPDTPAPLVILLHGYGASGGLEDVYLELSGAALERGVIFAAPDGTPDSFGRPFWNATDACCNFDDIDVDDSAYLIGLVDEIAATVSVDPARVFFAGHSNGGFMAHRMACEHADRIAGIAVLAGVLAEDETLCNPSQPVSVLQIHGTLDDTVYFEGGTNIGNGSTTIDDGPPYPGAQVTVGRWAAMNGCQAAPTLEAPLDLDVGLAGAETTVASYPDCSDSVAVALWSIEGGTHVPVFDDFIGGRLLDWLLAQAQQ